MPKVKILYEKSEGVWQLLNKKIKDGIIKIDKHHLIAAAKNRDVAFVFDEKGKYGYEPVEVEGDPQPGDPRLFRQRTWLGDKIRLPFDFFWEYIPIYMGSYKSNVTLPFTEIVKVSIDSKLLQKMSEEDTLSELLTVEVDIKEKMIMWVIFFVMGALVCYFLMTGDLSGIVPG